VTPPTPVGRPLRPTGKLLQEDARRHHRSLLLQHLFREGPASRADLARSSGLTRVTVSDLVGEMLTDGLVTELGAPAGSRVGKPPTLVGLAADSHHVIGLDLSETDRMSGAVVNLAGTVQARHEVHVDGAVGEGAVELVLRLAAELVAMTERPVLGIGVRRHGHRRPQPRVDRHPAVRPTRRGHRSARLRRQRRQHRRAGRAHLRRVR
jgi:hypothetical protein